ncbi:MAG: hypothetical protein II863_18760, partial [Kiritimatiellae bacterium]|nr:hypothetical protein [Kiritimatiellia bacterium]
MPAGVAVMPEDIGRGWRVAYVTNDWDHSFEMPAGASHVGNWHVHGGRSDFGLHQIDFGGWEFPLGTNGDAYTSFWYGVGGSLGTTPRAASHELVASSGGMLIEQGVGRMWTAVGEGGSRIVTWEDGWLSGDTNAPVCVQIELFPDGNFILRSNEVAKVCMRIDGHDWDGDGLDNVIDESPTVSDGDCFGTGMDWLNANCGGVLSAVPALDGGYEIVWHTNANANAYYWLSFTAAHDHTRVEVRCDGESNLGDLAVIANEGQACEVPLLMGPNYTVTANWPVEDISASDPEAQITVYSSVAPSQAPRLLGAGSGGSFGPGGSFGVVRPVEFSLGDNDGGGSLVSVPDVGAVFGSLTGNCCSVECNSSNYVWNCSGACNCSGYSQWWQVTALWEGYARSFYWDAQCGCQRYNETNSQEWVSLSCPGVIMKGGCSHYVSGVYDPPSSAGEGAAMSLECTAGAGKIAVLSSGDGWMEIQGVAASDAIDDVEFRLVATIGESTYTNTAHLTVARVDRMEMSCAYAGESANPPPFDGEAACPFSVTNSLAPDRHLVVPFCNVGTLGAGGFSVRDFTVDMDLVLEPEGVDASSLWCDWEVVEAIPFMSGHLSDSGGLSAHFVNPKHGGVFRFRARCDGCPWTEGNAVLPLSGASIDSVFFADMAAYDALMARLDRVPDALRQTEDFGNEWFLDGAASDYIGRVDSHSEPTVWRYNQVSDDLLTRGMGAVAMWRGTPARIAKIGNFMAGYGTRRLGIRESSRRASQFIGTENDESAEMSWSAGDAAFLGGDVASATAALATNMWPVADMKVRRLWPNTSPCDNHVADGEYFDYNFSFCSPGSVQKGRRIMQ